MDTQFLERLIDARAGVYAERAAELDARRAVLEMAKSAGRTHLSDSERREHDKHSATIKRHEHDPGPRCRIKEQRDEIKRSGRDNPLLAGWGSAAAPTRTVMPPVGRRGRDHHAPGLRR